MSAPRWSQPFLTIVAAGLVGACGDESPSGPTDDSATARVATVLVSPASHTLRSIGSTVRLTAVAKDAAGNFVPEATFVWTSSTPSVASVGDQGLVTAVADGSTTITAMAEGKSGSAAITVMEESADPFVFVATGVLHTCAVTGSGAAFCWGWNGDGQLGARTTEPCITLAEQCSTVPVGVASGLAFSSVDPGWHHTCGVTTSGAAYCWGDNFEGRLGDGTTRSSTIPVAVTGGHTFTSVSTGTGHTCGVTSDGAAYCWGANGAGQLGTGTATGPESCDGLPCSRMPVAVTGGLTFAALSAGGFHTCGVATDGAAYCWGANGAGQFGNGTRSSSPAPVAVSGGLSFASVSTNGHTHTCGVTMGGAAYCWGSNGDGQLGNGTETRSTTPVAVSGGLRFASVSAGVFHTCGLTTGGAAYCWGWGEFGQLGNGTDIGPESCSIAVACSTKPVAVLGRLRFVSVSAGLVHACGITSGDLAYCWGGNGDGQLGNGDGGQLGDRDKRETTPVRVHGQR